MERLWGQAAAWRAGVLRPRLERHRVSSPAIRQITRPAL